MLVKAFNSSLILFCGLISCVAHANMFDDCGIVQHQDVLEKIVKYESGNRQFAIGINIGNGTSKSIFASDEHTAVSWAKELLSRGYPSIDMGYGQINSKNLAKLGVSVDQIFDKCTNLCASQKIFDQNLAATNGDITAALSMYNTGKSSYSRGLAYAAAVMGMGIGKINHTYAVSSSTNPFSASAMIAWTNQNQSEWATKQ